MRTIPPGSPQAADADGDSLTQVGILVVDAVDTMRRIVSSHLRAQSAREVRTASNAGDAMKILRTRTIDVMVCAWNLSGISGLDLLRTVRENQAMCHLPVILTITEPDRGCIEQAIHAGVSDVLVRPFSLGNLTARIRRSLGRAGGEEFAGGYVADAGHAASGDARGLRATLLLVDDAPDNLHLLSALFKDDYRVRAVASGDKAVAICRSDDPPDLVLLDIMMPGIDGFEVARRMRDHPVSATIPIIFVTSMTESDTRRSAMDLGAIDFVTKPIDPDTLVPRVRNFLQYVELRRQLQADYDNMLEMARVRDFLDRVTRQDLKRPLSDILAQTQSLIEHGSMGRREVEQLRAVEASTRHALDVVDLSAELYRIETGQFRLDPQPVPLGEMLRGLVESARSRFGARELVIAADTDVHSASAAPLYVSGAPTLCHALLHNLLALACELAPRHSRIETAITDTDPLLVTIRFAAYLSEDTRARLFERSSLRGNDADAAPSAYSARLLAQAHQGSVVAHCPDGDHTVFEVRLPRIHLAANHSE